MFDVCRLCLSSSGVNNCIFDGKNELLPKITQYLPVTISPSDDLPKKICDRCALKITDMHEFCIKTVYSEKQLHLRLISVTSGSFEENDFYNRDDIICISNKEKIVTTIKQEPLEKDRRFSSKCTQTNITLNEISLVQSAEEENQDETIKVKEEPTEESQEFEITTDHNDTQYSSDDDLALNKIVKVPSIKLKVINDKLIVKKKKRKKKKPESQQSELEPVAKRPRGRPKGSVNKNHIEKKKTKKSAVNKCDTDEFGNNIIKDEQDSENFGDAENTLLNEDDQQKTWQCLTCFVFLKSRPDLLQHYKDHVENPSTFKIENRVNLEDDVEVKREIQDDADTNIVVQNYVLVKSPEFGEEPAYQCLKCCKLFVNKKSIIRHLICHDDSRPFPCNLCGRTYKRAYEILLHGRAHNGVKTLFCRYEQCTYSTVYRGALISHHRRHEPNYKYTCEVCKKGFDVLTWFTEHQNVHTGAKPFVCDLCGKSFIYSRYLASHRKSVHPETNNRRLLHRCTECSEEFTHKKQLRNHLARVHGAPSGGQVLCDICGKGLSSREHLKFHRRIHTGEKPHICRTCGKGFVKKCNMTLHERVHSGERPHVCSHCGKAFSQRSTLVIHERYHSGARPYTCQLCNKGFVAKGLLSMHLKTCL